MGEFVHTQIHTHIHITHTHTYINPKRVRLKSILSAKLFPVSWLMARTLCYCSSDDPIYPFLGAIGKLVPSYAYDRRL